VIRIAVSRIKGLVVDLKAEEFAVRVDCHGITHRIGVFAFGAREMEGGEYVCWAFFI